MKVYFQDGEYNTFCFKHAVKAVIEEDKEITAQVDGEVDADDTGWFPPSCCKCYPETMTY